MEFTATELRILERWDTGFYRDYAELQTALKEDGVPITRKEIQNLVDRRRKKRDRSNGR